MHSFAYLQQIRTKKKQLVITQGSIFSSKIIEDCEDKRKLIAMLVANVNMILKKYPLRYS